MESHGVVLVDAAGRIRFWSPGAEALFGYPSAEAVGKSLDLIIPERMRTRHWDGFRQAMGEGGGARGQAAATLPVVRKDGAVLPLSARFVALHDPRDLALGAVGIFAAPEAGSRGRAPGMGVGARR